MATKRRDSDAAQAFAKLNLGPSTPAASDVKKPTHVKSVWSGKGKEGTRLSFKDDVAQEDLDETFEDAREAATDDELLGCKTSLATGSKVRELRGSSLVFHVPLLFSLGDARFKLDKDGNMHREAKDIICFMHSVHNRFVPDAFFNVDVEGNELNVLKSLNFKKYQPTLICIEIHNHEEMYNQNSDYLKRNPIHKYLSKKKYKVVWSHEFSYIYKNIKK